MSKIIERLSTPILIVAAAAIAISVVKREFFQGERYQVLRGPEPVFREDWQQALPSGVRTGSRDAPVTIVELTDLECPACRAFHRVLKEVMTERPNDFSHVFVHFPLSQHRFATPAGKAAECAKTFDKFNDIVNQFFLKQDSLGLKSWASYASDAGITDTARIAACATNTIANPVIDSGRAYGSRLGANFTPTIIINGWKLGNVPDRVELVRIADALKKGEKPF